MKYKYAVVMGLALAVLTAQAAWAKATDKSARNALELTRILDGGDVLTQASDFSPEAQAVSGVIEGSPEDAKKYCAEVQATAKKFDLHFSKGWTAQISTKDDEGVVAAVCPL